MSKKKSQIIRLGVFVVLGTLLLTAALYFIGNRQHLFTKNIDLYSKFRNVNGLQVGNNVRYSGIDVGTVNSIQIQSDTLILVRMLLRSSETQFIKKNAVATIGSDGLVGNMIINIIPREGSSASIAKGDTISSFSRIGSEDMLTTLNVTNENAALLTADLLKITTEILNGDGTLGMLIRDKRLAQDLKASIYQLKIASTNTSQMIADLETKISAIDMENSAAGILLTDSIEGNKIRHSLTQLVTLGERLNEIGNSVENIVDEIENGNGALSYLTTDTLVVRQLDATLINIKESTKRFNENMEALRHNFLFRRYFKKQERVQRKEAKKEN
ncbi:MAG: MCE family protein [Flavobacteriaceae bacterium]|nr:MCE family protein [Flavobacteriaceae bacterium]